MRHFGDPKVHCPFYREHTMPSLRLTWHYPKCLKTFQQKNPEKTVYHCRYNYYHIFLDKE
jgi:hypothetical protein